MLGIDSNMSIFSQSMAGFFSQSKSAVIDNKYRQDIVSKSRVLIQKVPLAKSIIDILVRGVIGSGLHLKGSEAELFEALSSLYQFDGQRQLDFYQMQQQIFSTMLSCGECFLIRERGTDTKYSSWFVSEPDNVFNPPSISVSADGNYYYKRHLLVDGVEFKSDGTPYAIWYCIDPYCGNIGSKNNWKRIFFTNNEDGLPNVIHIRNTERPKYPRGLPILAPLIETLYSLYCFQQAQIQLAITQSCQCFVVKTEPSVNKTLNPFQGLSQADLNAPIICNGAQEPEHQHEPSQDFSILPPNNSDVLGLTTNANYIRPGQSYHLGVNESIEHLSTDAPGNSLREYYELVVEQCGSALGIPSAVLRNVYDTSFSSSKCSVAQWRYTISKYSKSFIEQCLKPVYRVFLSECGVEPTEALQLSINSIWRKKDPSILIDEVRSMKFYSDALSLGLVTREQAAYALFGENDEKTPIEEQGAL